MAVLAQTDVTQIERYAADPAASDATVLASLARLPPGRQEQALATLHMAGGIAPPPALLVWAAHEVGAQLQALLWERLAAAAAGGGPGLSSEPWYRGALQLAHLALASTPPPEQPQPQPQHSAASQPQGQPQQQPAPQPTQAAAPPSTELQLLRAFAAADEPPSSSSSSAAAAAAGALPYVVQWDALLTLPSLPSLLDAAAERSPALATTLALVGVRPPAAAAELAEAAEAASAAGAAAPLLPQLRAAAAAARVRALEAAGLVAAGQPAEAPLNADAVLTAVALGRGGAPPPAAAPADARAAAAEWLAAASLLRHAEERLGCAAAAASGGAAVGGAGGQVVACMQLLGLPLEPPQLAEMEELRVRPEELREWLGQFAAQLTAAAAPGSEGAAAAAVAVPRALDSRLAAARSRLAAAGRALVLAGTPEAAAAAAAGDTSASAAVVAAWLRAAGAPLAAALLSGGYGSLRPLRSMAPELREALLLRLLEGGRPGGGAAALGAALYGDAEGALAAARAEAAGAAGAAEHLVREGIEAELDIVRERFVPPPPASLPPPPALPSDAQLAAAVRRLPAGAREVYYNHYALRPGRDGGGAAAAAAAAADPSSSSSAATAAGEPADAEALARLVGMDAVKALLGGVGEGGIKELLTLQEVKPWLSGARSALLSLPRPLLSLLLRFVRVQVSITPEAAQLQRRKLLALLAVVAEQQARTVTATSAPAAAAAPSVAAAVAEGRTPPELSQLLGEQGAQDFASWVQALALNPDQASLSAHDLLAQQHLTMDVERYLTMTHDPRLALCLGGVGPASPRSPTCADWRDPALRPGEGDWLERMRPHLDSYLRALGHRPLGDAEWEVYRDAALAEWAAGSAAREERLVAAGASGFFNPRADEVYLQQLLETSIPPDAPMGPSSRRYLDTLLRNPSWSFAQRLRAVQRLVQLNDHFAAQPPAPEDGSPFAPLWAPGGPDPVPRLPPLEAVAVAGTGGRATDKAGAAVAGGAAGGGGGGVTGRRPVLRLPEGF